MKCEVSHTRSALHSGPLSSDCGWYVYGVTARRPSEDHAFDVAIGLDGHAPAQLLPQGALNVIVSKVPLDEFGPDAVRARLRDTDWLEEMVLGHGRVVEAVQRQRTVLPAKFGCVYPEASGLVEALDTRVGTLLAQLESLDQCEEWAISLYAHRATVGQRVGATDEGVARLHKELLSAPPGRAYFLRRKLADVLSAATEQATTGLAQHAYDSLLNSCLAGEISRPSDRRDAPTGEAEILRAAFLTRVSTAGTFFEAVERLASVCDLRCEYSGPWAPYSFATVGMDGAR